MTAFNPAIKRFVIPAKAGIQGVNRIFKMLKTWIPAFAGMTMLGLLLFVSPSVAFDLGYAKEDGGQAGAFLDYAASARSVAMGRAHVGVTNDAGAGYWNPSGLAQLEQKDVVTLYSMLEEDTTFGSASFGFPSVDHGVFGISLLSLRSGGFDKRDAVGVRQGSFDQSDLAVLGSHAFRLKRTLSMGTTLKVVRQEIDIYSDTGYGADVGLMWQVRPRIQMGFTLNNLLAPALKLKSQKDKFSRSARAGVGLRASKKWLLATDLIQTTDRSLKLNVGTEYALNEVIKLRAGLNETELTAGLGFRLGNWDLDYAFGYHQAAKNLDDLGGSHRVGFHYKYGAKVSEQSVSVRWQRRGQLALELLREQMDSKKAPEPTELASILDLTQQVVRHQGYSSAPDLYAAQGYVAFFKGEYGRSVQALSESLTLDPQDPYIARHLEIAKAKMTEEEARQIVASELKTMKAAFEVGNYAAAVQSGNRILQFSPGHAEAVAYIDDSNRRIQEPIDRELRIAATKMAQEEYFDAIKHLQAVKRLDPENAEADDLMVHAIELLESKANAQPLVKGGSARVFELQHDSQKSRQYYSQGLLFYSRGDLKQAALIWEQAVRLDSQNTLARNAYNRAVAELTEAPSQ